MHHDCQALRHWHACDVMKEQAFFFGKGFVSPGPSAGADVTRRGNRGVCVIVDRTEEGFVQSVIPFSGL